MKLLNMFIPIAKIDIQKKKSYTDEIFQLLTIFKIRNVKIISITEKKSLNWIKLLEFLVNVT